MAELFKFDVMDALGSLDELDDELDYDFSITEKHVDSIEKFNDLLLAPYLEKDKLIFYRGERINSLRRPLIPTLFRDKGSLMDLKEKYVDITSDYLLDFYKSYGEYYNLFQSVFGYAEKYHMYDICAFSQHYIGCSPLIDLSKSIYVALSFGLKGKTEFTDDPILYTIEIGDPENYTQDRVTAECWLHDYNVRIYNLDKNDKGKIHVERTSPEARLIDIANNDRMKFQQGVFLLLDNFNLVNKLYLTRKVRSSVNISKYILSKEICPELTALVRKEAPWYDFANLLDIESGIRIAIESNRSDL